MSVLKIDDLDEGGFITKYTLSGIRVSDSAEYGNPFSLQLDLYPETLSDPVGAVVGIHIYVDQDQEHELVLDRTFPLEALPPSLFPSEQLSRLRGDWTGECVEPRGYVNRMFVLMAAPFSSLEVSAAKGEDGTDKVRFDLSIGQDFKASATAELATFKGYYELL